MTRTARWAVLVLAGCGIGPISGTPEGTTVAGNYAVTYDDRVTLRLDVGGAVREVSHSGTSGTVDFGVVNGQPLTLDLSAFCAKPEVVCPSETFWTKVAITEPNLNAQSRSSLQVLEVVDDRVHALDAGQYATALAGLIDHHQDDKFLLGLGAGAAANEACVLLSVSLAGGRFTRQGERFETTTVYRTNDGGTCGADGGLVSDAGFDAGGSGGGESACAAFTTTRRVVAVDAPVTGIAEGKVVTGYAGGCAFGPALVGGVLTIETGFSGTRTGRFDPPPYRDPLVVLPDAGLDGGLLLADAGVR